MVSLLETLREYKHLAGRRKIEGVLSPDLESRFLELQAMLREARADRTGTPGAEAPAKPVVKPATAPTGDVPAKRAAGEIPGATTPAPGGTPPPATGEDRPDDDEAHRGATGVGPTIENPAAPPDPPAVAGTPNEGRAKSASQPAGQPVPVKRTRTDARRREVRPGPSGGSSEGTLPAHLAGLIVLVLLAAAGAIAHGLGEAGRAVVRVVLGTGLLGFGVVYPATLLLLERSARKSNAHLQPDFEARLPNPEPLIGLATFTVAATWLLSSGVASAGLGPTIGSLVATGLGLLGLGLGTAAIARRAAQRLVDARAHRQYLAGAAHHFEKNNPRRARRFYGLALESAQTDAERAAAIEGLTRSVQREASSLESRGLHQQARALRDRHESHFAAAAQHAAAAARTAATRSAGVRSAGSEANRPGRSPRSADVLSPTGDLPAPSRPRVLRVGQLDIVPGSEIPTVPAQRDACLLARKLEQKNRHREALETLLKAGVPVPADLARAAAQEYIQQGLLRSAFVVFETLREPQIPEFYRAVAVELSRSNDGRPRAAEVLEFARVLRDRNELEMATRLAVQGALSGHGESAELSALTDLGAELCTAVGREVPPELDERRQRWLPAARAYERSGRMAEALACYRSAADEMIANDERDALVPVASRMFAHDAGLDDIYLTPLAEHVISSELSGPNALRVLRVHRKRHGNDPRVVSYLFQLLVDAGEIEEAVHQLDHLATLSGSSPEEVLSDYRTLAERYPDDARVKAGLTRSLLRAGQVGKATLEVERLFGSELRLTDPRTLLSLIDSLYEWGHRDPHLRFRAAQLLEETGDIPLAAETLERYFAEGGRHPDAAAFATELLEDDLIAPSGKPNHDAHLKLARLLLHGRQAADAIRYLEIARGSETQRKEAETLLARAELMAGNPRRAITLLRAAIDGRHPSAMPEHYFELARAYAIAGDAPQAAKIDAALDRFVPGFSLSYRAQRPAFERATDGAQGRRTSVDIPARDPAASGTSPHAQNDAIVFGADLHIEAPPATLELPEAVGPRYALIKRIGSGGMGDVHLAQDTALGRAVAIKVLRRTLATDLFVSKFREEARTVAKLSHPGIVQVYDIGQKADWSFIVMEYVRGPNLAALIHASVPPSRGELILYVAQVADAMAYAHSQNVVHRDLKPANILVSQDATVKVTDFGIARVLQERDEETAFSAAGLQVGTVNYMAPEQITEGQVDGRTDIYLLGTTLYFALAKAYPFAGDNVMIHKLRDEPPRLSSRISSISDRLDSTVARALARDPQVRFQTMAEFAAELRACPETRGS